MKKFNFLSRYKEIFENKAPESEVKKLREILNYSVAMSDIEALDPDRIEDKVKFSSVSAIRKMDGTYTIKNDVKGLRITFFDNFTSNHAYIEVHKSGGEYTYIFKTAERTASFIGKNKNETPEQEAERKKQAIGFFRNLDKEYVKNDFRKKFAPAEFKWGKDEEGNDIKIMRKPETEEEKEIRLAYNAEMEQKMKEERAKRDSGGDSNYKYVAYTTKDFPIEVEFDNLEECLRWAWAFFVARKTSRILDPQKTFDYLMDREDLWGKGLRMGDRYGDIDYKSDEGIVGVLKKGGLLNIVGTDLKDVSKTVEFIKDIYKLLGLNIEPIKGKWGAIGDVSRGIVREDDPQRTQVVKDYDKEYVIGFEISKTLSNENTILGIASKSFTEKEVKYMEDNLIFELAPRDKFKYKHGAVGDKRKVPTVISDSMVRIYFECRTEEEAFRKLLLGFKIQEPGVKAELMQPLLLQAFSKREKVIVGKATNVQKKYMLALITIFTKYIKDNIAEFIPQIKSSKLFADSIPTNISMDDPRILKGIMLALTSRPLAGKSLQIKNILKEEQPDIYNKMVDLGLSPVTDVTNKEAEKDAPVRRRRRN